MHDLKTQLTEYLDHVVERGDVDEIFVERVGTPPVRPLRPRRPQQQRRHWNGWAVAAVAFVAAVLAGVVVGLLTGDASVPVVDTPPSTLAPPATTDPPTTVVEDTEAAPTTTVVDADAVSGPVLEWEQIEEITPLADEWPQMSYSAGEYAVMQYKSDGSLVRISTSADGIAWSERDYSLPADPLGRKVGSWAVGPDRIVALGSARGGANSPESALPLLAIVIDRTSGEVRTHEMPSSPGRQPDGPVHIASDGSLLVATSGGRSWRSVDGAKWTEVSIDGLGGLPIASFDGTLIAARHMGSEDEDTYMYRSDDGANWERIEWFDGVPLGFPTAIVPWRNGYLTSTAIEWASAERPSPTWQVTYVSEQGTVPLGLPSLDSSWLHVGAGGLGVLVVQDGGHLWFSQDGETWSVGDPPEGSEATFDGPTGTAVGPHAMLIYVRSDSDQPGFLRGTVGLP